MAKKLKGIKADTYDESIEVENELEDEVEETYDIEFEDFDEDEEVEDEPKKFKAKKKQTKKTSSEDEEEYEDAAKTFARSRNEVLIKVFNIFFVVALIAMIIIGIDVICVAKYDAGPFFAIKTATYKDGGTKVYYGLGYKVIKYNQIDGRRDTQIGFWNLPYNSTPTKIQDIDLAIEFQNNPEETGNKYYKQYLSISSKIKSIDKQENQLTLEYTDPDGKYTLQIVCPLASQPNEIINFTEQQEVTIKGTVYKFALKDDKQPNTVYLKDCFAK